MPCRDDGYDRTAHNYESDNKKLKEQCNQLQKRLDVATLLLCGTLTNLKEDKDTTKVLMESVDGLYDWWAQHQEEDRRKHQTAVASAKSKLNNEEFEALVKELKNSK